MLRVAIDTTVRSTGVSGLMHAHVTRTMDSRTPAVTHGWPPGSSTLPYGQIVVFLPTLAAPDLWVL